MSAARKRYLRDDIVFGSLDAKRYCGGFNIKPLRLIEGTHKVSNPTIVPFSTKLEMRLSRQSMPPKPLAAHEYDDMQARAGPLTYCGAE